jgi:hypothetical protein
MTLRRKRSVRRMQRQENDYLVPPPLTSSQVDAIYGHPDKQADVVGRTVFKLLKAAARKGAKP